MVYPPCRGSTRLLAHRTFLPRISVRHKSLTAAIERGRASGSGRFSGPSKPPRETASKSDIRSTPYFDRRDNPRHDGAPTSREHWPSAPRSSRFGRVGPPGGYHDAPSRLERRDRAEKRDHGGGSAPHEKTGYVGGPDRVDRRSIWDRRGRRADNQENRPQRLDRRKAELFDEGIDGDKARTSIGGIDRLDSQGRAVRKKPSSRTNSGSLSTAQEEASNRNEGSELQHRAKNSETSGRDRTSNIDKVHGQAQERNSTSKDNGDKRQYGMKNDRLGRDDRSRRMLKPQIPERNFLRYTTAASEFVYGYSSVVAALKANRRKFYKLYIQDKVRDVGTLMNLLHQAGLTRIVQKVGPDYEDALNKASGDRPHNGVVLESSPLPTPPITELQGASIQDEVFGISVGRQTAEERLINGTPNVVSYKSDGWRFPLVLYIDGVLDEGNLGAIARSAYCLGVDAIVTAVRQTAPWSTIAIKASAGAVEGIPIFRVDKPIEFLSYSSAQGWKIFASGAVPSASIYSSDRIDSPSNDEGKIIYSVAETHARLPKDYSPVAEHPTILMMGAEETGLRATLLKRAYGFVSIPHKRSADELGVDSLNVSVATSLLCYEMLQKRSAKVTKSKNPESMF